jgi:hypothetical protein
MDLEPPPPSPQVMNRKLVPKEQGQLVLAVAMHMCLVLQGLLSQASGASALLEASDEDLLAALIEFMAAFLEQHLGRVLNLPTFPMYVMTGSPVTCVPM